MTPDQCRAARAWLNWSRGRLAWEAGVSTGVIIRLETMQAPHPKVKSISAMRLALEQGGIVFPTQRSIVRVVG